ncbi:P27 family phage terminase small subunit [Mesorhizobium sp. AR07]|uniref:P27 family phage terminase small subunit n=1 Tax=Mesorhizobium sp. AR07 TaxID=2865838 RepID=UPI00216042D1|nr:P27 family phage terminase small subunit [Mesorhizobium sp. AR07]
MQGIEGGNGTPDEPDWASLYADEFDIAAAHEEWGIVVRELRDAVTLSVANGHAVRRLVEYRVQFERASRHVAEYGPILEPTSKKAKVGQWNPYWSVMRQAGEAIRALEAELGLAPVQRDKGATWQKDPQGRRRVPQTSFEMTLPASTPQTSWQERSSPASTISRRPNAT